MTKINSLSRKSFLGLMSLSLILVIGISIAVTIELYSRMMTDLSEKAHGCALSISESIDGDSVAEYISTRERDEYYDQVREQIVAIKANFNLMYCYVYIPDEEGLWYLWDADDEGENIIGDHDPYSDKGKELSFSAFTREPVYGFLTDSDKDYGDFMATCAPIYDSAGNPVALSGVDISTSHIRKTVAKAVIREIIIVICIMLFALNRYYRKMKKDLVNPVLDLTSAANNMVDHITSGEIVSIPIHTGDEIESLARSFEKMNRGLAEYISENARITAEKERIGAELNVATQIQADMLPSIFPAFPDRKEFDLYATMNPAKEVGGDFYDFFLIDDDHIALVMADVSDKGVPAALFMVIAKTMIKNHAQLGEYSPEKVLSQTNEQLCEGNEAGLFVTVWLAIIQISTGKGFAANAGHEHPALRHKDGQFELVKYRHSPAVATMEGLRFREHEFQLLPGDSLFVYTDGVTEATNADDEQFGEQRLLQALNQEPHALPKQMLKNVRSSVNTFVGDAPQFDDLTMLGFTYYGTEEPHHV